MLGVPKPNGGLDGIPVPNDGGYAGILSTRQVMPKAFWEEMQPELDGGLYRLIVLYHCVVGMSKTSSTYHLWQLRHPYVHEKSGFHPEKLPGA